jgi:ankyrin repeat protein
MKIKFLSIILAISILGGCNIHPQMSQPVIQNNNLSIRDSELSKACLEGNLEEVEKRLKNGSNINSIDSEGYTPFLNAVRSGNLKLVDFLLNNGANIRDKTPREESNALMIASSYGYKNIVEYLLSYNGVFSLFYINVFPAINIYEVDKEGRNALFYASSVNSMNTLNKEELNSHKELVDLFLEKGLDINSKDYQGNNILVSSMETNFIDFLISKGVDIKNRNKNGNNFLERSLIYNPNIVGYLIKKGLSLKEIDENGNNIISNIAKVLNEKERASIDDKIFQLILNNKIDLNHKNLDGDTPLIFASKHIRNFQSEQIILFLLENGADPNIKNNTGNTYLDYLFLFSDDAFLKTLIEKKYFDLNYKTNKVEYKYNYRPIRSYLDEGITIYKRLSMLDFILLNGGSVNSYVENNQTLLQYLIKELKNDLSDNYYRNEKILLIKDIINKGADIYLNNSIIDILSLNYELSKYILSNIDNFNLNNNTDNYKLFHVISDSLELDYLISKGFNINTLDEEKNNLLISKLENRNYYDPFLLEIIDRNININQINKYGGTALIYAINKNNIEVALRLIDKGADINIKENNKINETPLSLAKKNNITEILNFIEKRNIK